MHMRTWEYSSRLQRTAVCQAQPSTDRAAKHCLVMQCKSQMSTLALKTPSCRARLTTTLQCQSSAGSSADNSGAANRGPTNPNVPCTLSRKWWISCHQAVETSSENGPEIKHLEASYNHSPSHRHCSQSPLRSTPATECLPGLA